MVTCNSCNREMLKAKGCLNFPYEFPDGTVYPRVKYGQGEWDDKAAPICHDCGAHKGHYHHPSCDMEVCARCGGQAISCECNYTEEENAEIRALEKRIAKKRGLEE